MDAALGIWILRNAVLASRSDIGFAKERGIGDPLTENRVTVCAIGFGKCKPTSHS